MNSAQQTIHTYGIFVICGNEVIGYRGSFYSRNSDASAATAEYKLIASEQGITLVRGQRFKLR